MDSQAVRARARDPKRAGWLPRDAADVGTGEVARAGDSARIQLRIDPATQRVVTAVFKAFESNAVIASASLVAERLEGATLAEARAIDAMTIIAELQLPIEHAHVATVVVAAAGAALDDWEQKQRRREQSER